MIADNINRIQERIAAAGGAKLMLAVKHQPLENMLAAYAAGCRLFGHNIVQQFSAARLELPADITHTIIGPVQTNKINAAKFAQRIDTVASFAGAQAISKRLEDAEMPILLQVNSAGAPGQSGCNPEEVPELAAQILSLGNLKIEGLMTIGAHSDDPRVIAKSFAVTREALLEMQKVAGLSHARELSMGMSADLEIAIAQGATTVRVGSAVFGARN